MSKTNTDFAETSPIRRATRATFPLRGKVRQQHPCTDVGRDSVEIFLLLMGNGLLIGLIEVMKLFSSIRAGVDGEVVKILVENGSLVEFDQALIFVAPRSKG